MLPFSILLCVRDEFVKVLASSLRLRINGHGDNGRGRWGRHSDLCKGGPHRGTPHHPELGVVTERDYTAAPKNFLWEEVHHGVRQLSLLPLVGGRGATLEGQRAP